MAKRIKRSFHDQRDLIELRRIFTDTAKDIDSYVKGFGSIVKLSQDLWITFPLWMKLRAPISAEQLELPYTDTPTPEVLEPINDPKFSRPDDATQLADLLVLRSFHETTLITISQLLKIKSILSTCRKKLQTEPDIDSLRLIYTNEIMPVLIEAPTRMGEAAMALKSITDKYTNAIHHHLPEHIVGTFDGFISGAVTAVESMLNEAPQFPDVNLFDSTQTAADTPGVPDLADDTEPTATPDMAADAEPGTDPATGEEVQIPVGVTNGTSE